VRGIFSSARRRRRLAWGSGIVAVGGGLVAIGVLWPDSAERSSTPVRPGAAQVYHAPKTVRLTNTSRAKALATAANFVRTAVARQNVDRSWELASTALRQGYTRSEWSKGAIPVVPYPVAQARWKFDYSYEDALGLQVLVYPRAGEGETRPNLFLMELKQAGDPAHRHWVVDSWTPSGVANPALRPRAPSPGSGSGGAAIGLPSLDSSVAPASGGRARLGAAWLLVPLGLFAIVPIVLGVFAVRSWRRSRRAERAYREHAQRRPGAFS
jgi:hypothetical protein